MSSRGAPYRRKPTALAAERLEEAKQTRMYLVQRPGPLAFVLKQEDGKKVRVRIGNLLECNCHAPSPEGEPCVHIIFALLKILRLPPTDERLWQSGLTDLEVADLLSHSVRRPTTAPSDADTTAGSGGGGGGGGGNGDTKAAGAAASDATVKRKALEEEEVCPICQEEMTVDEGLTWCKKGCGNNIHIKCMKVWADHKASTGDAITCPLCRADWGEDTPKALQTEKASQRRGPANVHYNVHCAICRQTPLYGNRYRCVQCMVGGVGSIPWAQRSCECTHHTYALSMVSYLSLSLPWCV